MGVVALATQMPSLSLKHRNSPAEGSGADGTQPPPDSGTALLRENAAQSPTLPGAGCLPGLASVAIEAKRPSLCLEQGEPGLGAPCHSLLSSLPAGAGPAGPPRKSPTPKSSSQNLFPRKPQLGLSRMRRKCRQMGVRNESAPTASPSI